MLQQSADHPESPKDAGRATLGSVKLQAIREQLRTSLWFVPALFAVAAALVAAGTLAVDSRLSRDAGFFFLYGGTAEGARSVLSTIAQSMLTFTGLVFTITMLVLQLASSQLSPRVMRTFLRDRANQVVLGLFVATFVFTLVVLRDVRTPIDGDAGFVPGLSIWVAFALLLASVGAFIYYIDHMAHAIRASTVVRNIASETEAAIERLYPDPVELDATHEEGSGSRPATDELVSAAHAGVLVGIDEQRLLAQAGEGDRYLELIPPIGDFVPSGAPLLRLGGRWDREAVGRVVDALAFGEERTLAQDPAFGFRQLVDVAIRALSPGTNDPTTAVQGLDRLHELLRRLAGRAIPSPRRKDDSAHVRLLLPRPDWDDYVGLAIDEIRLAGQGQVQIARRLAFLLADLLTVTDPERQGVLRRELRLLRSSVERSFDDGPDVATAMAPSARGHAMDVDDAAGARNTSGTSTVSTPDAGR